MQHDPNLSSDHAYPHDTFLYKNTYGYEQCLQRILTRLRAVCPLPAASGHACDGTRQSYCCGRVTRLTALSFLLPSNPLRFLSFKPELNHLNHRYRDRTKLTLPTHGRSNNAFYQ